MCGQNQFLRTVTVATGFYPTDESLPKWADELARRPLQALYGPAEGRSWVRLRVVKVRSRTVRIDVHLARESYFKGAPPRTGDSIEEVQAAIEEVVENIGGFKTARVVDGEFDIPRVMLPERGIISAAFGIAMSTGGAELTFTGATMSVSAEPFTELEWKVSSDLESVDVMISAFEEAAIENDFLERAVRTVQDGFDRFVLEKTRRA